MNIITRQISIVVALLILLGGAFYFKKLSDQKKPPKEAPKKAKILQSVEAIPVESGAVTSALEIHGRLKAFNKIDIFSEVSGTLKSTSKPFKVGTYFEKGATLLQIDDEEARLNLLAQKSSLENAVTQMMPDLKIDYPESFQQWKNYLDQFDVHASVKDFPKPLNDPEKYLISSRNLHNQYYTIQSAEARLRKYSVSAPFSGVITQTSINPGSLVRAGQKMGELMNTYAYELEATVALNDLKFIKPGNTVSLQSDNAAGSWKGKVKRVSDQIDPNTQSVLVFIGVSGPSLREGMYLRGKINAGSVNNAIEVNRDLLVDKNNIYTIQGDTQLVLQPIEVVRISGTKAIIKGLNNDAQLVKETFPGIYDGMKINIRK